MIYGNQYQIVQADPMELQLHPDIFGVLKRDASLSNSVSA